LHFDIVVVGRAGDIDDVVSGEQVREGADECFEFGYVIADVL